MRVVGTWPFFSNINKTQDFTEARSGLGAFNATMGGLFMVAIFAALETPIRGLSKNSSGHFLGTNASPELVDGPGSLDCTLSGVGGESGGLDGSGGGVR